MTKTEIIQQLKHPRNPYDRDLIAIREGLLSLLEPVEVKAEVKPEVKAEKPKKVKTDE